MGFSVEENERQSQPDCTIVHPEAKQSKAVCMCVRVCMCYFLSICASCAV